MMESIKKDPHYSLNRMDDYIFDHHFFILVELNYLKGNHYLLFFHYLFIQNTCEKSLELLKFLDLTQLLLAFFPL